MDPGPLPYQGCIGFANQGVVPESKSRPRLCYSNVSAASLGEKSSETKFDNSFWNRFEEYVKKHLSSHTAKCRIIYARKYIDVLIQGQAQDLMTLSNDKRIHVMKALSTLSKYIGCHQRWKSIVESYQLKWSSADPIQVFNNITNLELTLDSMVKWFRMAYSVLPETYGNILLFDALVGLRPREACQSILFLHENKKGYLNKETMILEHFRFPETFIRRTKKAYISIVTNQILKTAKQASSCGYNTLRLAIKKKGFAMHMSYCRKIYATFLRNNGIEPEIIDLLQGRIPNSVFVRNYYRPNFDHHRIQESINSLYRTLIEKDVTSY